MKLILIYLVFFSFALSITSFPESTAAESTTEPTTESTAESAREEITIGVIVPLTGIVSYIGEEVNRVIEIIIPQLNAKSANFRYQVAVDDGKCGIGGSALTAAQKMISIDKIKFIITGCSGETLLVGPLAEKNKVLAIAIISNHKDVKYLGDYVFRTYVDIERGIKLLAQAVKADGNLPIAVITEDNAFTQGMKDLLTKELGADITYSGDYLPDTTDFKTLLLKATANPAKAIYLNSAGPSTLSALINQARQLNLKQQLYSFVYPENPEVLAATKANANGVRYLSTPDITTSSDDFQSFMEEFRKRYPEGPKYDFLVRTTYDALMSIFLGVEQNGGDPSKVKDFLYSYTGRGALGEISFDENGDVRNIDHVMKAIVNGTPRLIETPN